VLCFDSTEADIAFLE